jgi:hypothetical protein
MREGAAIDRRADTPEPGARYEPPAIQWEEELPQGPNLFSACGKIGGGGDLCNSAPAS